MSAADFAPDAKALVQQRIADIKRRHPEGFTSQPAAQEEPAVVPSSARTAGRTGPPPAVLRSDVQIRGEVVQEAKVTTEAGTGNAVLKVLFRQRFGALPVLAMKRYDASATSHTVAHSSAHRLKVGTEVSVRGEGFRLIHRHGEPVLEVLLVHSIESPPEPTTRKDLE